MYKIIYLVVGVVVLALGTFIVIQVQEAAEENEMNAYVTSLDKGNEKVNENSNENKNASGTKTYTMAEISLHNKKSDCWMSINGVVLDVTNFVDKHPGGDKILQGCGADATAYFSKVPGHVKSIAQALFNKLKIGDLQK